MQASQLARDPWRIVARATYQKRCVSFDSGISMRLRGGVTGLNHDPARPATARTWLALGYAERGQGGTRCGAF